MIRAEVIRTPALFVATSLLSSLSVSVPLDAVAAAQHTKPAVDEQAKATDHPAVAEFRKRCDEYVALHKRIEGGLPKLPERATPEQIDQGQQALSKGIESARAGAKPGDVFVPAMANYVRQALGEVFRRPEGKQLRSSILDENPIGAAVRVNGPYPDAIALSTMPPQLLAALPKLPDELEYRFIGERLILFDHHAHVIVDYVDRALPRI
jgi:hypothetical protein